jgi:hypothetical protein
MMNPSSFRPAHVAAFFVMITVGLAGFAGCKSYTKDVRPAPVASPPTAPDVEPPQSDGTLARLVGTPIADKTVYRVDNDSMNGVVLDPRVCEAGAGASISWAMGSGGLEAVGQKEGRCEFRMKQEVEGGYSHHKCSVEQSFGPVVLKETPNDLADNLPDEACELTKSGSIFVDIANSQRSNNGDTSNTNGAEEDSE